MVGCGNHMAVARKTVHELQQGIHDPFQFAVFERIVPAFSHRVEFVEQNDPLPAPGVIVLALNGKWPIYAVNREVRNKWTEKWGEG